tara:strand:- start:1573 stop:2715 length:1143 start_codon:yes stop_codon:yes gene_type:complete
MNQTLKSSLLLISLLGVSFFAFRFLTNSLNQQGETTVVETTLTTTTTQKQVTTENFKPLETTFDDFIDDELALITDSCIKFGSWFSLSEECLNEWFLVLNNIEEKSILYSSHYDYSLNYFLSNYQSLNKSDLNNILASLEIEAKLTIWNEKLIEVTNVLNIKSVQEETSTAIFLDSAIVNKSKNIGTSDLNSGCIDSNLISTVSEQEWIEPENVNPKDEEKFNYGIRIEPSLGLDPLCIKNLLFLILNNDLGWKNVANKSFQLTSAEDSDYIYIFASPDKTDELCAPIETNSIYSCRNENNIVLNFFRWQEGAVDFKNDMETYRIYLINHETGHILGWGHVGCPKEGAVAPVMMQQSKGTDGCVPYGWPVYETVKSKYNR